MKTNKPEWLKVRVSNAPEIYEVSRMMNRLKLHTVCQEANCPNVMECFGNKTATFMILGRECTRQCTFCNVTKGSPTPADDLEPVRVAQAVLELGLKHVVVTSVTRDDLPDGGAGHFARVIEEIRRVAGITAIEVLIPDFRGDSQALSTVVMAKPQVINHNIETVKRLYPDVRPIADYSRSLALIKRIKELNPDIHSKSGFMVGLGETPQEVEELLIDLRTSNCEIVTIGQYLAPSDKHHPVIEYIHPERFSMYKKLAGEMGFKYVASSPLVRSSYHAGEALAPCCANIDGK